LNTPRQAGHVPALDGLRGVAIALVVTYHSLPWVSTTNPLWKGIYFLASLGWAGVDLFFVLSGYLITGILLDGLGAPGSLRAFYTRRVLRIFPACYVLLGVLLGLRGCGLTSGYMDLDRAFAVAALYVSNFYYGLAASPSTWAPLGVTWSLAVEEQFYLVWPFVVRRLGRSGVVSLGLGLFLAVTLARVLLVSSGFRGFAALEYLTFFKFDALGTGALLAALLRDRTRGTAGLRRGLRVATLAAWPLALALGATNSLNRSSLVLHSLGFAVLSVAFGCAVGWSVLPGAPGLSRLWSAAPLRYLGRISYGLYLYHQVANWLFADYLGPHWLAAAAAPTWSIARFLFVWIASIGVAEASWRFIEAPCLRRKPAYPGGSAEPPPARQSPAR
jgi:peptidoglycan/LPS O-acetylase OafA/YrhL